jgi:hypothetical protein
MDDSVSAPLFLQHCTIGMVSTSGGGAPEHAAAVEEYLRSVGASIVHESEATSFKSITHVFAIVRPALSPLTDFALHHHIPFVSGCWIKACSEAQRVLPVSDHVMYAPRPQGPPPSTLSGKRVSISGFVGLERALLVEALLWCGASYCPNMDRRTSCLICVEPREGTKYQKSLEWEIPVENAAFVWQILAEWQHAQSRSNMTMKPGIFPPSSGTVDVREKENCPPILLPNANRVSSSVALLEKKTDHAQVPGRKQKRREHSEVHAREEKEEKEEEHGQRPKVLVVEVNGTGTGNNGAVVVKKGRNKQQKAAQANGGTPKQAEKPCLVALGSLDDENREVAERSLTILQASSTEDMRKADILVMADLRRTEKFLWALVRPVPLAKVCWLENMAREGQLRWPHSSELWQSQDVHAGREGNLGGNIAGSCLARKCTVWEGRQFCWWGNTQPPTKFLRAILRAAGAKEIDPASVSTVSATRDPAPDCVLWIFVPPKVREAEFRQRMHNVLQVYDCRVVLGSFALDCITHHMMPDFETYIPDWYQT